MGINSKNEILTLFYIEHLKAKEIANKLNFSAPYITKIIKQDARYDIEKKARKQITSSNRKTAQNKFAKEKRERKRIEDNYQTLQAQHTQASIELSKNSHLSNKNYHKWNRSAYQYNPSKNRYEFKEGLGRSADVPKYIKY